METIGKTPNSPILEINVNFRQTMCELGVFVSEWFYQALGYSKGFSVAL